MRYSIKCLSFLLLIILPVIGFGQTINVDIGTGTSTSDNSPIQRFYDYSASELLYLGTEVNTSGNITGLGFYKGSGVNTVTIDSVYIYLKETSLTALTITTNQTGYTLVYKGPFPNTAATGWLTVDFNVVSNFAYNTANNISMLLVRPYQAQTTSRPYWRYSENAGSRNAWYRNNTTAWAGTMNEVSTWRPNIRFVFTTGCSGTPNGGTTASTASVIPCNTTTTLSLTGNTIGTGIAYQWQYNTSGTWVNFGTSAVTQTTPPVTQSTQFRCVLTCTNPGGGVANSTPVSVTVNPIPVSLGNDTTICPGVAYVLDAGNSGASYAWNTSAGTQAITVNSAGTFSVLVTLANGCTGSDAINITPGIVPLNNLPALTDLCVGDVANLNAGNAGSTFLWTPGGATTQTINVTNGGLYQVTVRSSTGCVINSNTNVVSRPLPVPALGADTSICNGAQILLDAGNTGSDFLWNNGANTQTITVTDSGMYTVTITTPFNCTLTDEQQVSYLPAPYVEGFNFIPLFYENLGKVRFEPLNPVNTDTYAWDFGDGSAISNQVTPTHTYASTGDYVVTLTVFNDCGSYSTALTIHVDLVTGITSVSAFAAKITLYPNPAREYLIINNQDDDVKMQQVMIFNTLGSLMDQSKTGPREHRIPVAHLSPGLYMVRIVTDKGYIIRKFELQ